jgi:signal transduction histidine kinase
VDQDLTARWRVAMDAAEAAIFELDVRRDVVSVVPSALLGSGLDPEVPIGCFFERIHAEDRPRVEATVRLAAEGAAGAAYRDEFRTEAGTWLGAVGRIADGKRIVGVLRNESERRLVDDTRLRALHELSLSARSAEVFVSMVAHDLKNPIGVLMGSAHNAMEAPSGPMQRRALDRIRTTSERLASMVQQLRDYSTQRPAGVALERTEGADAAMLVERAIAALGPKRTIERRCAGDTRGAWDEARLEHALLVLLDDASAATTEALCVSIAGSDPRAVVIEVTHGAVLPAETVENAFRPFGRGGLSLFAARQAVVAHGGDITLASSPDEGTKFRIYLPRKVEPTSAASGVTAWDELVAAEGGPQLATGVTASLYGAVPLFERAPATYWKIFERYAGVFDDALNRRIYRGETRSVSEETRGIAEALGALGAGAYEVAELHARALRQRLRDASPAKAQALIAEGRLLAFEVMGHLVTWYRRRCAVGTSPPQATRDGESDR